MAVVTSSVEYSTMAVESSKSPVFTVNENPPPNTFIIDFGVKPAKYNGESLQDAFLKYKRQRQNEVKKVRKKKEMPDENRLKAFADPERMWNLRMKFLNQAKKYFGVPYAKKYWKEGDAEYNSKIFLDCCGLVRRCLRDLRKDFGFKIGPWNQGYMYDTLPITITEEEMRPGDLVFISATYYNPRLKKQKHDMTHVEIWLGDGPKTIGSRWNKGHVQVFDSYAFEAKSYHSPTYHFKSIDTWLMGICRSHCKEHGWKTRAERIKLNKKSIFNTPEELKIKPLQRAQRHRVSTARQDSSLPIRNDREPAKPGKVQASRKLKKGKKKSKSKKKDVKGKDKTVTSAVGATDLNKYQSASELSSYDSRYEASASSTPVSVVLQQVQNIDLDDEDILTDESTDNEDKSIEKDTEEHSEDIAEEDFNDSSEESSLEEEEYLNATDDEEETVETENDELLLVNTNEDQCGLNRNPLLSAIYSKKSAKSSTLDKISGDLKEANKFDIINLEMDSNSAIAMVDKEASDTGGALGEGTDLNMPCREQKCDKNMINCDTNESERPNKEKTETKTNDSKDLKAGANV